MRAGSTHRIHVECVIRGYISGIGLKEYCRSGTLAGEQLKDGLVESRKKLDATIFSYGHPRRDRP